MFGLWYITIAVAAVGILAAVLGFVTIQKDMEVVSMICIGIAMAAAVAFVILLLFSSLYPLAAANTANKYANMYETYRGYSSLLQKEGFGALNNEKIGNKIIEYNEWLANALASKETYGCFSSYLHVDLSSLKFIDISFGGLI